MKAEIKKVQFIESWHSDKYKCDFYKYGVSYINENLDEIPAIYISKSKDQKVFIEGEVAEFTVEEITGKDGIWKKIKPVNQGGGNPYYVRERKREQSRYSGFAMSYAKDLVIADKLKMEELLPAAEKMFNYMVELDKRLES